MRRLRDLPGEARLVLAAFLLTLAGGYFARLVHSHEESGEWFPGLDRVRETYAGPAVPTPSRVEHILEATDGPFNAKGTMRPAFTTRSRDWDAFVRGLDADALRKLTDEREGERLALVAWVRAGADRGAYDRDDFTLGADLGGQPITPELLAAPGRVKVRTLIARRCVDCHSESGRAERARLIPFDSYERMRPYLEAKGPSRRSVAVLAQATGERLISLGVVFGVTGVLFAFTGAPRGVRFVLAPLPLLAQGVAVGCWWLARWDASFAVGVLAGEVAAAVGFAVQVLGGLAELAARRVAVPDRVG